MDRPWLRQGFKHPDLKDWTAKHRGQLIAAALTLVQAWIAVGRRSGKIRLGMFESWSDVIGGILWVAGVPGFLENLHEFYDQADADGAAWRSFLEAWWERYQDKPVSVADLLPFFGSDQHGLEVDLDLGEGNPRSQMIRLGKRLAEKRDRQFGRWRITSAGMKQGKTQWRLIETPQPESPSTAADMEEENLAN
jgi:hypothetical protein